MPDHSYWVYIVASGPCGWLTNLLFLCARNRLRSPTAERVFASRPGVETASAGLAPTLPFVILRQAA